MALCDDGKVYGIGSISRLITEEQKAESNSRNFIELKKVTENGIVEDIFSSSSVVRDAAGANFLIPKINGKYYIFIGDDQFPAPTILEDGITKIIDYWFLYSQPQLILEKNDDIYICSRGYNTGMVEHKVGTKSDIKYIGFPLSKEEYSISNTFLCLYNNGELSLFTIDTKKTTSTGEITKQVIETDCIEVCSTVFDIYTVSSKGILNTYRFDRNYILYKEDSISNIEIPNFSNIERFYRFSHNFQTGIIFYRDIFGKIRSSSLFNEGAKGTGTIYLEENSLNMIDEEVRDFINLEESINEDMIDDKLYEYSINTFFDKNKGTMFSCFTGNDYPEASYSVPGIENFMSYIFGITKCNIFNEKIKVIPDISVGQYRPQGSCFYYINENNELKIIDRRKISAVFTIPNNEKIIFQYSYTPALSLSNKEKPYLIFITNKKIIVFNRKRRNPRISNG